MSTISRCALLLLAVSVVRGSSLAAQAEWPPAMYSVGSAYDEQRGVLVVFGGYSRGGYSGDTWEWNGRTWRKAATDGPRARNAPALAYDAERRQVVLFGGDTRETGPLGDTWVYDSAGWRPVATGGPPARTTAQMVYDRRRARIVLVGGAAGTTALGGTWEWDGVRWHEVARDGPARALHGLAYDARRGVTVLFGGITEVVQDAENFGDTWEWDGTRWSRRDVTGPSPRDHVTMGYDRARNLTILHGGGIDGNAPAETWQYDGETWSLIGSEGPRRRWARLEFDDRSGRMLLYGGFDRQPSNVLFRLDGSVWVPVDSAANSGGLRAR